MDIWGGSFFNMHYPLVRPHFRGITTRSSATKQLKWNFYLNFQLSDLKTTLGTTFQSVILSFLFSVLIVTPPKGTDNRGSIVCTQMTVRRGVTLLLNISLCSLVIRVLEFKSG